MFFGSQEQIKDKIVRALAGKGAMSTSQLHASVNRMGKAVSRQAIYKELSELRRDGIVFKLKKQYGLSLVWITEMNEFTQSMQRNYFDDFSLSVIVPEDRAVHSWKFRDLVVLDDFWNQLLLSLIKHADVSYFLEWVPHPWYHLLHPEKDLGLEKAFQLKGISIYQIVGGESYLDRVMQERYSLGVFNYSFAEGPFHKKRRLYLDVIGDYVLSITLAKEIAEGIDAYFEGVKSQADISVSAFVDILSLRHVSTVTVEKSPQKAARYKRQFGAFFGQEFD